MNHLLRPLAPITDAGWEMLDDEARERLTPALAARRLVEFAGPHGWDYSATNTGRVTPLAAHPVEGVRGNTRRVLAVTELRAEFAISRAELDAAERGADDADLAPLDEAAHRLASAENSAVFHGLAEAVAGIIDATPHTQGVLPQEAAAYPAAIAAAVETLLESGITGPYGLALGRSEYRTVAASTERGSRLFAHLETILGGPIVWTPGLTGAVVLSTRGGDFVFQSGQDISVGYLAHDAAEVSLYLEESFSFHVATPEAAVALTA